MRSEKSTIMAYQAVKIAEDDMREKAIEAFCQFQCPDSQYPNSLSSKDCRDEKPCASLGIFIALDNDNDKNEKL